MTERNITRQDLLPGSVITLRNVLDTNECKNFIELGEKMGFTKATLDIGSGTTNVVEDVRNHYISVAESKKLAGELWGRIHPLLDGFQTYEDGTIACFLDKRLRFYRYDQGQRFVRHYDGYEYGSTRYDPSNQNSAAPHLTCLLYLNDDYKGGKTTFFDPKGKEMLAVPPEPGMALIFSHKLLNECSVVTEGRKYIVKTDVMFAKRAEKKEDSYLTYCVVS